MRTRRSIQKVAFAAIQMAYKLDDYSSREAFRKRVLALTSAVRQRVPDKSLLVAFPEDVGLGLLFTQDFERVRTSKTIVEAGTRLMEKYRLSPFSDREQGKQPDAFATAVRKLIHLLSPFVERVYHETFAEAARTYRCWLIAGSAPLASGECVYNTCYVYNPSGERILIQRKVNLVPLEQEAGLNLCPADAEHLTPFETPAGKTGVLICYDAFFSALVDAMVKKGARVPVQPSFNPLPWTKEQCESWEAGLLAAAQRHPHLIGVNPMGVGQLFDVVAEGVSSIVAHKERTPDGTGYLARAKSHNSEEILIYP
ncbi:MAG: nitrilase-related carbon-nitrogen hydrolase [Armatimonadota bacterium]